MTPQDIINILQNREETIGLYNRSGDLNETERLTNNFLNLRRVRISFFLTLEEFDSILHWKLRQQYQRQQTIRELNNNDIISLLSKTAFLINHNNDQYNVELKIKILCCIRGVSIPVASAILALTDPNNFCVIDTKIMSLFFQNRQVDFPSYYNYLTCVRDIGLQFQLQPLIIDGALWQYHIENNH